MHLMQKAIAILRLKKVAITEEEERGLLCAILLHDIGHGPFSHALEKVLVPSLGHEQLSLLFMKELNEIFEGALDMAILIFKGLHPKKFLNQLVSSQLDMDRLDYLKRDSFYTGVTEGNISSDRLIAMLTVVDNNLVVEEKGLYSVEKFLLSRRFMYWQVYLHKTSLVAELLLTKVIARARTLLRNGVKVNATEPLSFFLKQEYTDFDTKALQTFSTLDDVDILGALKSWQQHEDMVLSDLSKRLINRNLLKIEITEAPWTEAELSEKKDIIMKQLQLRASDVEHYVFQGKVAHQAYHSNTQNINILSKTGQLVDVAKASDHLNLSALSKKVVKYYVCFPKVGV